MPETTNGTLTIKRADTGATITTWGLADLAIVSYKQTNPSSSETLPVIIDEFRGTKTINCLNKLMGSNLYFGTLTSPKTMSLTCQNKVMPYNVTVNYTTNGYCDAESSHVFLTGVGDSERVCIDNHGGTLTVTGGSCADAYIEGDYVRFIGVAEGSSTFTVKCAATDGFRAASCEISVTVHEVYSGED